MELCQPGEQYQFGRHAVLNHSGKFSITRFVTVCNQYRLRKFFLVAHSLDLIIPLVLAAFIFPAPLWVRAASTGIVVHMAMDLYGNGLYPKAYFLSWRIFSRFDFRRAVSWLPESGLEYWGSYGAFLRGRPDKSPGRRAPARPRSAGKRRIKRKPA